MSGISHRKGAVSIFVVVFTALLITVVTVSFVRLMVRDQQRASDGDLSRSAYDSAMVGVEDAKRALSRYYGLDRATQLTYDLENCNSIRRLLTNDPSTAEEPVRTDLSADADLNQAYTCVQVKVLTDDYERAMMADESVLIPLQTRPGATFSSVRIQWFVEQDLADGVSPVLPGSTVLSQDWPDGQPPVIETQFIQTSPNFSLDQFDNPPAGGQNNTNTLFLFPRALGTAPSISFNSDIRRTPQPTSVTPVRCTGTFESQYLCSATIAVPDPVSGSASNRSNAHLRITPRYRGAQVQVSLLNAAGDIVQLDGVQPEIDSTGRANDLFRRVSVRVESGTNVVYPAAAIDISGNFCKTFSVTDRDEDYLPGGCTP